jgi:hypothetical protein
VGRKREISGEQKGGEKLKKRLNFNCMYTRGGEPAAF